MPRLRPIAIGVALCAAAGVQAQDLSRPDMPTARIAKTVGGMASVRPASRAIGRRAARPAAGARARPAASSMAAKTRLRVARKHPRQVASPAPRAVVQAMPPAAPEQRDAIYRTVAREQPLTSLAASLSSSMRVIAGPLASGQIVTARPPVTDRVVVPTGPDAVAARSGGAPGAPPGRVAPDAPAYPVGSQLPPMLPLYAIPAHLVLQMPGMRSYSYALVDRRVLVVDPMTYTVVADIGR
jgi:hypothetical protein